MTREQALIVGRTSGRPMPRKGAGYKEALPQSVFNEEAINAQIKRLDTLVYEAYCAGVNQQEPGIVQVFPEFETSFGEIALKASLWCKHVGTR